jgi:HD-like signal output (HDOD) protein
MSRSPERGSTSARSPAGAKVPRTTAVARPPDQGVVAALDRLDGLPVLPAFITQMLARADDPEVSAREIADLVSRDQAMASRVLRLVNAPFYGLDRRISSIQHAVLLLGMRTMRNLALSAVLVKSFGESSPDRRFDRVGLWRHAVVCAMGARLIAEQLATDDPEEAFLAGLVHDMGIVVLDQFFHDGFRQVIDLVIGMGMPLIDAEREVFACDHSTIGRQLARRWNFPAAVAEAIGCHHQPARARINPTLASVVHLSDWLEAETAIRSTADPEAGTSDSGQADSDAAQIAGPGEGSRAGPFGASGPLDPSALEVLGLAPEDLKRLQRALTEDRWRAEALASLLP